LKQEEEEEKAERGGTEGASTASPTPIDEAERSFFESLQTHLNAQAREGEDELRQHVCDPKTVCGVDAAYLDDGTVVSVASLIDSKTLALVEQTTYRGKATFPYVPGLFYLREGPFACRAVSNLEAKPDVVCFDAHGLAHPRRKGLATICGIILGIPSVGISKSKLIGRVSRGSNGLGEIYSEDELVGYVTSNPRRFWSPGFMVSIRQLEDLIVKYGKPCLKSLSTSHDRAQIAIQE
jgi:deoxyribonuclease V